VAGDCIPRDQVVTLSAYLKLRVEIPNTV